MGYRKRIYYRKENKNNEKEEETNGRNLILQKALKVFVLLVLLGVTAYLEVNNPETKLREQEMTLKRKEVQDPPPAQFLDFANGLDQKAPLVVVGGLPGAGTRLMKTLLDSHPDIMCGEGVDAVHRMVRVWRTLAYSQEEVEKMILGGLSEEIVDKAMSLFLLEVMGSVGPPAPRLCTRDPLSLVGGRYLMHVFPNIKYVFMVRDTRAAAYSLVNRQTPVMSERVGSIERGLYLLENLLTAMRRECVMMGPRNCLPVQYESLILRPRETMEKVVEFLGATWSEEVLPDSHRTQHDPHSASNESASLHHDSLTAWVQHFPPYMRHFPDYYYRQLPVLGYNHQAFPPDYGRLAGFFWSRPEPQSLQEANGRFLRLVEWIAARRKGTKVYSTSKGLLPIRELLFS